MEQARVAVGFYPAQMPLGNGFLRSGQNFSAVTTPTEPNPTPLP